MTAATAATAGRDMIHPRAHPHHTIAGTKPSLGARTDYGRSACTGAAYLTHTGGPGMVPNRAAKGSQASTVGWSWPGCSTPPLETTPYSRCSVGELTRFQRPSLDIPNTPASRNLTYSAGGSAARVPTATSEEGEGREEREESKEREGEQAQSRSDRWKAKHEAMLKQAEEAKNGTQQVFESSNLVITLNESTRREEGESEALQRKILSSGSAESGPDAARLTRQSLKTVMAV